jgi:DNA repair ATPase RecN
MSRSRSKLNKNPFANYSAELLEKTDSAVSINLKKNKEKLRDLNQTITAYKSLNEAYPNISGVKRTVDKLVGSIEKRVNNLEKAIEKSKRLKTQIKKYENTHKNLRHTALNKYPLEIENTIFGFLKKKSGGKTKKRKYKK